MRFLLRSLPFAALLLSAACGDPSFPDEPAVPDAVGSSSAALTTPGFNPLPDGIGWGLKQRFPVDNDLNGARNERNEPWYVQGNYEVHLSGCAPADEWNPPPCKRDKYGDCFQEPVPPPSAYRYTWTIDGVQDAAPSACFTTRSVPTQGRHQVGLRVDLTTSTGAVWTAEYTQTMTVKDYLIVSIGDSYGSGEGAPDTNAVWDQGRGPVWANKRCHRSFNAAAAKAALALEESDPTSTVTYVSLACSGATLRRLRIDGSGVLGGYAGAEPPANTPWLRSQMDELRDIVGNRPIDMLVLSAGGNDIGFGDALVYCVKSGDCATSDNGQLGRNIADLRAPMPYAYGELAQRLKTLSVRNTYLMEYPDPVRDVGHEYCSSVLKDSNFFGFLGADIGYQEVQYLDQVLYRPLLGILRDAASTYGWNYVTGMAEDFAGTNARSGWLGRGYCTPYYSRWINTVNDAEANQGPDVIENLLKTQTTGAMHPNVKGYDAMAARLKESIQARSPLAPPETVPLTLWFSGGVMDNFSSATLAGDIDARNAGYGHVRTEGYVFPTQVPGTVPLKLYYNHSQRDNFTTATVAGEQDAINAGYAFVRIEGYVYPTQMPGTVPLKSFWNGTQTDNFTTATPEGEAAALAAGYWLVRIEGYVYR